MNWSCDFWPGRPAAFHASCSAMAASISASSTCSAPARSRRALQRVVLVHQNHDSGFATETDDIVTVVL